MDTLLNNQSGYIRTTDAQTLYGLFEQRLQLTPDGLAYRQYDTDTQAWLDYTWNDVERQLCRYRTALLDEDVQPGDRVAVLLKNSVEWVCFDLAAQALGLITIALYPTDTLDDIAYILADAEVRLLILRDTGQWQRLAEHCTDIPSLQRIWYQQHPADNLPVSDPRLRNIDEALACDVKKFTAPRLTPDDTATIIYTSGTTGRPKGVMLSHRNILSNAEAVQKHIPAYADDAFLSFLPLAHGFERTVEYILPMMTGSCVAYARSIKTLAEDLLLIRPTVFLSPPRLYEKIYAAIQAKLAHNVIKQSLFGWTLQLGWRQFQARQQRGPRLNFAQVLLWRILHKLVIDKVLARLGGRIRVAVTGAAPLPVKVGQFFLSLDFPLVEGYGLTEAGPVVSGNHVNRNYPGSVGEPLPGVEVRLSEAKELLVRSAGVMQGYWRREQATQQVLDGQGWLYTGDVADIHDGIIYIRGRLKDILVMSTGEKVAPADIEAVLTLDPLFEQAMLIGEGKPFLAALLVVNPDTWPAFVQQYHPGLDAEQALQDPAITRAVLDKLGDLLHEFPGYAQIHAVHLTDQPWTIDNDLLTPTLKLKRKVLEQRFAGEIAGLYQGHVLIEQNNHVN